MYAGPPGGCFHRLEHIVRIPLSFLLVSRMMFEAESREEIGRAIPRIVECLKDSTWHIRSTAVRGLSSLGAYRMCPSVSPLLES